MSSKRYPEEFKIEAVKQVSEKGHSVADVANCLGTTTHSLYAWVKRYGPDSSQHQAQSDESAEIRRLRKELQRVTEERDILKNVWSAPFLQVKARCQNTFASMYPAYL